jgi:hypothetical protein
MLVLATLAPSTNAVHAATPPPPTLEGEILAGTQYAPGHPCNTAFNVTGTAAGPYTGTFTEQTGNSITFGITSADGTSVTGTKQFVDGSGIFLTATCTNDVATFLSLTYTALAYTATIHTPTGNYRDEGTSNLTVIYDGTTATLTETFDSSLTEPVLIAPTSKAQCKNNGFKNYPQFKNQGECVNYVDTLTP